MTKVEGTYFYKLVSEISKDHRAYFQDESIDSLLTFLSQKEVELHTFRHNPFSLLFGLNHFEWWWLSKTYLRTWQETRLGYLNNLQGTEYSLTLDVESLTQFFITLAADKDQNPYHLFFNEFDQYVIAYEDFSPLLLRRIGYWSGRNEPDKYPTASNFIQEFPYPGQQRIATYLRNGYQMSYIMLGYSTCRICGKSDNGTQDLSDGKYIWPEGLAHYVESHNLRLPKEFETHVASDWEPIDTEHLWMGEWATDYEWWLSKKEK